MKFPARDRVLYDPNPLIQVVCNVSFPRILAIDHELPVGFQQDLIEAFPFLETQEAPIVTGATERAEEKAPRSTIYEFYSSDRNVTIALGADFVGIRVLEYERWEKFRDHIRLAVSTLLKHYSPKVFTRLSLNYVNSVERSKLGLEGVPWRELIAPELIGPFAREDIPEAEVESYASVINFPIAEGTVRIAVGTATPDEPEEKQRFLIDNLFLSAKAIDADEQQSLDRLSAFNAESGCVFQWCIRPRLHDALNPRPVS
ncbi:TIGR04255 family protein [Bradyrhizobium sp. CCGE-LA001]|uniref:TIGR04255 family protein n=1 Tax=Bradyrhizobium sp. CCGE-LA001 TaxID=1223566 RepID=UPI0002AAD2EC|nr:TIGR04255 family protein [Bradyrhizobium sp. CCGE-LA001]AMA55037.1 hypothetical protein BCCGELA001_01290 [Bradyrhizobium sp. CCGE-LA001]